MHLSLAERCRRIELLVLDVDGVLTEGSIIYAGNDLELKHFHVRDGAGIKVWQHCGKRAAIISGRSSPVVALRAAELDIAPVVQGALDKLPVYRRLLQESNLPAEQVCCMGDDVMDVPLLRNCGLAASVPDACPEAIAAAHYVTRAAGGRGAVREVIELILRCQGHWQTLIERHFPQAP